MSKATVDLYNYKGLTRHEDEDGAYYELNGTAYLDYEEVGGGCSGYPATTIRLRPADIASIIKEYAKMQAGVCCQKGDGDDE